MVFRITLTSLINFELILVHGARNSSSIFFLHMSVQFSQHHVQLHSIIYPIVCSCLLCQVLIDQKGGDLFLGSQFCSIGLYAYFYASDMLFCILRPCSIVSYKVVWFLQLCSFSEHCGYSGSFVVPYHIQQQWNKDSENFRGGMNNREEL